MNNIKKLINWTDGMKLGSEHFIATDNFHIQQVHQTRQLFLNDYNFGLLPSHSPLGLPFTCSLVMENDQACLTSFSFSLIMPDGTIIRVDSKDFTEEKAGLDTLPLRFSLDTGHSEHVLIVKAMPYERISYGIINSEEVPLKRPYALQGFRFLIQPSKKIQEGWFGRDYMVIARFRLEKSVIEMDTEYIPPVTTMTAHEDMRTFWKNTYEGILQLEAYLITIANKHHAKMSDNLRETLFFMARNLLASISSLRFELKHHAPHQPPIFMLIKLKGLASIIWQTLEIRDKTGKDSFLLEVNRVLGLAKKDFVDLINKTINMEYHHYKINLFADQANYFLNTIVKVFGSLAEHDRVIRKTDLKIKS